MRFERAWLSAMMLRRTLAPVAAHLLPYAVLANDNWRLDEDQYTNAASTVTRDEYPGESASLIVVSTNHQINHDGESVA